MFGASGPQAWLETLAAGGKPLILFVRHRSGPFYLWYEIAHWRLLRKNEDAMVQPHLDVQDIVVDEYSDLLWRFRALYGLKNARGTKMLAIGGLRAYSAPGQELGPKHAQDVWGYTLGTLSEEDFPKIESKMHELVKKWEKFEEKELTKDEAINFFKNNEYKVELKAAMAEVKALLDSTKAALDAAPKGKGTQADLAAMKADLEGAAAVVAEAQSAFNAEKYIDAKAKLDGAKQTIASVNSAIEAAKAAKAAAKGGRR